MEQNILTPKYRKNKKPVKVRKPSRPIDGINHRLLREQAAAAVVAPVAVEEIVDDNAAPTREELTTKAKELGVRFNARTSDETLLERIEEALGGEDASTDTLD
jgi:hypothetical protein